MKLPQVDFQRQRDSKELEAAAKDKSQTISMLDQLIKKKALYEPLVQKKLAAKRTPSS